MKNTTPMMKQYLEVKEQYPDYILMYRLGDFYECFFDDALIASRELELTLTARDCGEGRRAAMCGVPFHKADVYVGRLVERGYKVAICEQTEDPKSAVGLVKREVTRVVTPGTITDGSLLAEGKNNFLVSICVEKNGIALGFADISTAEVSCTFINGSDAVIRAENEIASYQPAEAIINVPRDGCREICDFLTAKFSTLITDGAKRLFDYNRARESTKNVFGDEADKLTEPEQIMAVGALLSYISETQKTDIAFAKDINVYARGQYLEIDINTRRNLELTESMRTKEKRGSLLWILDKTKTAMGARLIRSWILKPLIDPAQISNRQAAVNDFVKNAPVTDEVAALLSATLDIERLTAKAVYGTANAKDLRAIYQSIEKLPEIKSVISALKSNSMSLVARELDTLEDIAELLGKALVDTPPFTVREGGMIRDGFDQDVDYYRTIKNNGTDIMRTIEEREKEETGIKTLKVAYNKVFGYYIEVSKSFIDQVPDRFIRKQTLTNCERYITQELKEMENTIFSADEKLVALEFEIFTSLRNFIVENCDRIRKTAALIAEIDVYRSLAEVARKNSYVCPDVDMSTDIVIKDGRHPVVEKFVTDSYFVPNDTLLNTTDNRMMIITGPNMAGKSTYMRQVAIITLMAQIGSFVPAREARIGIVDKIFTRVGASDDLASGQSTFMLEMNEVAAILKGATKKSLIIYDEVGRGTSTYDGMAIARAVVEYTHSKKIGAKTLFATHYHELTDMEEQYEGIVNYNIAAKKRGDSVIFLRKIVRGGTDDSYGIEVAKLAGVPNDVVKRAKEILAEIEKSGAVSLPSTAPRETPSAQVDMFAEILAGKEAEVAEKLRAADINTMTPIEAMNLLFELKKMLD
ncbi:MAG: DNA mismatch repair protein MutS [Clostridia bacterium]|nr:DNA mismatch repair protein MutS [Clostridia bacterium]